LVTGVGLFIAHAFYRVALMGILPSAFEAALAASFFRR